MLTTKEILTREEVMEILKIGRSTFISFCKQDS